MTFRTQLLIAVWACAGCTSLALERRTLQQEATPTDIRYQEVLNNLAMVAHDPATLPAYSSIFAGSCQITDIATFVSNTTFGPGAAAQVLNPQYNRAVLGNWTLDPINVPEKLEAIRCACRWVIYGQDAACKDCPGLLETPEQAPYPGRHFGVADRLAALPRGWLHIGKLCEVPLKACYKAHCGPTWVWIMAEDLKALADFTLVLQDIARVDINSLTILFIRPTPSDFQFPTTTTVPVPCCAGPYVNQSARVLAAAKVNPCGVLAPDLPYYRWRLESVGTDPALRSQINASGFH
jgi:hypothetical protein